MTHIYTFHAIIGGFLFAACWFGKMILVSHQQLQQTLMLSNDLVKETRLGRDAQRTMSTATRQPTTPEISRNMGHLNAKITDLEKENIVVTNWHKTQTGYYHEHVEQFLSAMNSFQAVNAELRGRIEKLEQNSPAGGPASDSEQARVGEFATTAFQQLKALHEELKETHGTLHPADLQRIQAEAATGREQSAREGAEAMTHQLAMELRAKEAERKQGEEALAALRAETAGVRGHARELEEDVTSLRRALDAEKHRADMAELCAGISSFTVTVPIPRTSAISETCNSPPHVDNEVAEKLRDDILDCKQQLEQSTRVAETVRAGLESQMVGMSAKFESLQDKVDAFNQPCASLQLQDDTMATFRADVAECKAQLQSAQDWVRDMFKDQKTDIMSHVADMDMKNTEAWRELQLGYARILSVVDQVADLTDMVTESVQVAAKSEQDSRTQQEEALTRLQSEISAAHDQKLEDAKTIVVTALNNHKAAMADEADKIQLRYDKNLVLQDKIVQYARGIEEDLTRKIDSQEQAIAKLEKSCREEFQSVRSLIEFEDASDDVGFGETEDH